MDYFLSQLPDIDPEETHEWVDSLDAVLAAKGPARTRYIIAKLMERASEQNVGQPPAMYTPYINTIPAEAQPIFPGDVDIERRIRNIIRWNAAAMVIRANKIADGIGGHLSTFASSAELYEVGFNHFFRGNSPLQDAAKDAATQDASKQNNASTQDAKQGIGDHVYFQGHAAPGVYARAYIEGRLTEEHLDHFRMEVKGDGLSSYPHPRLMPDFWEYPTVSMGLGPINSIYHARFNRYLHNRGMCDTSARTVWCFLGDGECDEPETLGAISMAGRSNLSNLKWIVNCNLQRLDGPVRGNGKIIQELEGVFRGADWNVIKVIWGSQWDELLYRDVDGVLLEKMSSTVDGEYQRYAVESGSYIREHFFGANPKLRGLVQHLSDEQLRLMPRGGHDHEKVYAAYKAAVEETNRPTVILAKTIKGWTLGEGFEGRNATHQIKKMTKKQLLELRERLHMTDVIRESELDAGIPPYYRPSPDSEEYRYMVERRLALNGFTPRRVIRDVKPLQLPDDSVFNNLRKGSQGRPASTTSAFTSLLRQLMRDKQFGSRVVPIVPDEARTFGMDSLFREFRIYAPHGQLYEPVDHNLLLSYIESVDGQILEEGITECGSMASWTAAGTSYANTGVPMMPFYIFYSMFGFQRVGDSIWAAADSRARGFLIGATAGRTTLMGEGLQHQDGHSLLLASTVPACESYDPAFAYELSVIIEDGLRRMAPPSSSDGEDIFYYITVYNENYLQPPMPVHLTDADIMCGIYKWDDGVGASDDFVGASDDGGDVSDDMRFATILFSGTTWSVAREAQKLLYEHHNVSAELWSVTSYQRLRRDALAVERRNRLHPGREPETPIVAQKLAEARGPIVAVSDYMKIVPEQIARFLPKPMLILGTDGFGRSDTRETLRSFFEVDAAHTVVAVLTQLMSTGEATQAEVAEAIERYGIDPNAPDPSDHRTGTSSTVAP